MSSADREELLTQPGQLCRIATVTPTGAPHVTPIWFLYEDGTVFVTPRAESSWLENLRREPRVAITIDEEPSPYRKITIEGTAEIRHEVGSDDAWRDLYRRIAKKYTSPEGAEAYIQRTIDQPRALIAVKLAEAVVKTWRMPVGEEDGTGIWHRRYYKDGSMMAAQADQLKS
jgi:PPOX class probable F420-dependent enzyme